jgi:[ribosomal protein S5]-alanine N-acetyltransferase
MRRRSSGHAAIETARLRLDPIMPGDGEALHALWTLPEVRRHLWDDRVVNREETAAILRRSRRLFAARGFGLWSVREKPAPELVGFGGYWYFRDPPELELVLGLRPDRWRRGLATEAGHALIRHGFDALGFSEVRGSADARNTASIHLMQRLGMGCRRAVAAGCDTVFYRIARDAWAAAVLAEDRIGGPGAPA